MKVLGRYHSSVARRYADLLADNDIHVIIDDPGPNVVSEFVNGLMGRVTVFVPDEMLDKATSLVRDFERKVSLQVESDSKDAARGVILVFLGILAFFLIILFLSS